MLEKARSMRDLGTDVELGKKEINKIKIDLSRRYLLFFFYCARHFRTLILPEIVTSPRSL